MEKYREMHFYGEMQLDSLRRIEKHEVKINKIHRRP